VACGAPSTDRSWISPRAVNGYARLSPDNQSLRPWHRFEELKSVVELCCRRGERALSLRFNGMLNYAHCILNALEVPDTECLYESL
jgi:hypothetical protein